MDIASCMESQKSRCSCLKNGQTCTRLCRCVNCNNACQEEKSVSGQRKGCTCGSMKKGIQWLCVRIKLKGSRDVPVYALVKSVPAPADVQTAEIKRAALRTG